MTTLYTNPGLAPRPEKPGEGGRSYDGYVEPDTKVPPKARPVLQEISVNGVNIPEGDILNEAQNHPAENPGEAVAAAARALVIRELLLQKAREQFSGDPEREQVDGRAETVEEALVRKLVDTEVTVPLASDEECERYYQRHPEKFASKALYDVRHILLAARQDDIKAREKAAQTAGTLCTRLQDDPSGFAAVAREFSACSSAQEGGHLGQISAGETVAEFEAALANMSEGDISPAPVESRYGYHIIALDKVMPARQLPFEHVREQIAAWLEASSWSRAVSQYIAILAAEATIKGISLDEADGPLVQ